MFFRLWRSLCRSWIGSSSGDLDATPANDFGLASQHVKRLQLDCND
jgi:hypothetical protein